jgi:nicotinate-nucleotide--dimethylbenzimidazole phosphoribosyltransferase
MSEFVLPEITPIANPALEAALQRAIDSKTKPQGALGKLEALALQIGLIQRKTHLELRAPQIVVFASDHGVCDEGVSAYPQAVTAQMVANMVTGGAAVNVFARQMGFGMTVVDVGVAQPIKFEDARLAERPDAPKLLVRKIAHSTRNMVKAPAMSEAQLDQALETGAQVVRELAGNVVAFGDMGIGNTTASALLLVKLAGVKIKDACGRGTGIDDAQLHHKREVMMKAHLRHKGVESVRDVLACFGGFEIAAMCGAMLQAASERRVILVDGFIASAAALCAVRMNAAARDYMVFGHCSAEGAHTAMLDAIGAQPLLRLDMRLGEGTGALLAWPLLQAAAGFFNDMASFEDAGVSERQPEPRA